jgi:hypothetical protein
MRNDISDERIDIVAENAFLRRSKNKEIYNVQGMAVES